MVFPTKVLIFAPVRFCKNMMKKIKNPWLHKPGYNCICCSPTNPLGLHLEFWEDGEDIVTHWEPSTHYQGWLNTLHGGIQSMLLDEVAGWVVTRKLQTTGVTSKMEVQYLKPISTLDEGLTIRARIVRQMRNVAFIEGEILNHIGEVCSKAVLTYFCASKQKAVEEMGFEGCELEESECEKMKYEREETAYEQFRREQMERFEDDITEGRCYPEMPEGQFIRSK